MRTPRTRRRPWRRLPCTNRRRIRAWCPECGVVESIVELERYADIGDHGMVPVNIDDDAKSDAQNRDACRAGEASTR